MTRAACLAIAVAACIGQTPDDRERNQVPSVGRKGPTHNPGSPCLLCHGFALAGTVYLHATDSSGYAGATVKMIDADAHSFSVVSNSTGNFFVNVDPSLSAPATGQEGEVVVPWSITYPVNVEVSHAGSTKKMRNTIHQWGSCAACHTATAGATSNGRVFVEDP